jgi:hypothetical protein
VAKAAQQLLRTSSPQRDFANASWVLVPLEAISAVA